ncbi:hypothetical protein AB0F91_01585 [Amycolatopsis sp. NPDC023774]|uniref:hypothetical protein n=1 Tax=Amycolatopsis sp. NPDC023774 TaxID=3155015 RepID=UPI0033D684F6
MEEVLESLNAAVTGIATASVESWSYRRQKPRRDAAAVPASFATATDSAAVINSLTRPAGGQFALFVLFRA